MEFTKTNCVSQDAKIQGNDGAKDTHLQSFHSEFDCVLLLRRGRRWKKLVIQALNGWKLESLYRLLAKPLSF